MKPVNFPSPELLRELLRYDPATGKLYWLERTPNMFKQSGYGGGNGCCRRWNAKYANKEAFTSKTDHGYRQGRVYKQRFTAHRVIWAMVYGEWPKMQIDHVNGDGCDNRINNLRHVSISINQKNSKMKSNNTSGQNGVSFNKLVKKWHAYISIDGRRKHLGFFNKIEEAKTARLQAQAGNNYTERHGT